MCVRVYIFISYCSVPTLVCQGVFYCGLGVNASLYGLCYKPAHGEPCTALECWAAFCKYIEGLCSTFLQSYKSFL